MMIPLNYLPDEEIANVLTYVRNSFGNSGDAVTVDEVRRIRSEAPAPATTSSSSNNCNNWNDTSQNSNRKRPCSSVAVGSSSATSGQAAEQHDGMVLVPAGRYTPLFRAENDAKDVPVKAFYLDVVPVTQRGFPRVRPRESANGGVRR